MVRLLKLVGVVTIVFVINIALLVGVIGLVAVNAGPEPSGNGDLNGDGGIDLGDAIYLLSYLFEDGPEPVAIAECPTTPSWPPRPEDIVHLGGPTPPLTSGAFGSVYTVPAGYYLVVTNFQSNDGNNTLKLHEDDGTSLTIKFNGLGETANHPPYASSVGIPFAPGSDVVVEAIGGSGEFPSQRAFELTGYLSPAMP